MGFIIGRTRIGRLKQFLRSAAVTRLWRTRVRAQMGMYTIFLLGLSSVQVAGFGSEARSLPRLPSLLRAQVRETWTRTGDFMRLSRIITIIARMHKPLPGQGGEETPLITTNLPT